MPHGTVVSFIPELPSTQDTRPRDPDGRPGAGAILQLLAVHEADRLPKLAKSTQASYRQTYRILRAAFASHPYPNVAQCGRWVTMMERDFPPPPGCRESWTVWVHWHNAAALYTWAQKWGHVAGCNPFACVELKKPQPRARAIVDLVDLWPAIVGVCRDLRERALLQTARDTGGRCGELLGLYPHDLNALGEPWRLHFERQRPDANSFATTTLKINGGVRDVPVTAELRAVLVELLAQGPAHVWTGRGGQALVESPFLFPYRKHELMDLRRRVQAVAPDAFPPGDWLHTLRHTLAFELNRSGASDEEVQKQLGHTSAQTTREVYVNVIGRPVDAGPMARVEAARRAGVVKWGAPPGVTGPPGMVPSGPKKRTAGVRAPAVQERSDAQVTSRKENHTCSVPSRSAKQPRLPGMQLQAVQVKPRRSASAATPGTTTKRSRPAAGATSARARSSTPPVGNSRTSAQVGGRRPRRS